MNHLVHPGSSSLDIFKLGADAFLELMFQSGEAAELQVGAAPENHTQGWNEMGRALMDGDSSWICFSSSGTTAKGDLAAPCLLFHGSYEISSWFEDTALIPVSELVTGVRQCSANQGDGETRVRITES